MILFWIFVFFFKRKRDNLPVIPHSLAPPLSPQTMMLLQRLRKKAGVILLTFPHDMFSKDLKKMI